MASQLESDAYRLTPAKKAEYEAHAEHGLKYDVESLEFEDDMSGRDIARYGTPHLVYLLLNLHYVSRTSHQSQQHGHLSGRGQPQ